MPDLADFAAVTENLDYLARVNRAIDHILGNLSGSLRLADVAKVACFSPYHFHRVFRAAVGETLGDFIKRVRLERALFLRARDPARTLTEIALACGFSSSSDFSRAFKQRYGAPPRLFDVDAHRESRREAMQARLPTAEERERLTRLPVGENPDGFVATLRRLPARTVAYVRVFRPFEPGRVVDAAASMVAWAEGRDLADGAWLGYMWDDPDIVPLDQCRYDVGLEVPASADLGDEVSRVDFPEMTVAELDIAGPIDLEQRALDWLYGTWLPTSGTVPAHQPCFEAWRGRPFADGHDHFALRLHLPVVDAGAPL